MNRQHYDKKNYLWVDAFAGELLVSRWYPSSSRSCYTDMIKGIYLLLKLTLLIYLVPNVLN